DQAIRHGREPGERAGREIEQQQRSLHAEPAVQLLPALVSEHVAGVRRVRARSDEEDVVHLVSRLGERYAVLERVDDPFARREAYHLMQGGIFDPEVDERDPAPVLGRRAGAVPGRRRGPFQVPGCWHESVARVLVEELWDMIVL